MSTVNNGAEATIKLMVENRTLDKAERAAMIEFDDAFDYVNDDADLRVVIAYLEMGLARNAMDYWNEKRQAYEEKMRAGDAAYQESEHWATKADNARIGG